MVCCEATRGSARNHLPFELYALEKGIGGNLYVDMRLYGGDVDCSFGFAVRNYGNSVLCGRDAPTSDFLCFWLWNTIFVLVECSGKTMELCETRVCHHHVCGRDCNGSVRQSNVGENVSQTFIGVCRLFATRLFCDYISS